MKNSKNGLSVCYKCNEKLLSYGSPSYEIMQQVYKNYCDGENTFYVECISSKTLKVIVRFLETKGHLLTTEYDANTISVKPNLKKNCFCWC